MQKLTVLAAGLCAMKHACPAQGRKVRKDEVEKIENIALQMIAEVFRQFRLLLRYGEIKPMKVDMTQWACALMNVALLERAQKGQ